jgi:hypothetical protein
MSRGLIGTVTHVKKSRIVCRQKIFAAELRRVEWPLVLIVALACASCLSTTARNPKSNPPKTSVTPHVQTQSGLSKTAQPQPAEKSVDTEKRARSAQKEPSAAEKKNRSTSPKLSLSGDKLQEELRHDANDLARDVGAVVAMKLCHDKKAGEWWLVLYRDTETAIDIRQFIWSLDKDEYTPFLVIKHIPKGKLKDHLTGKEQGKTCVELPAPPRDANDPFEKFWGRGLDFGK